MAGKGDRPRNNFSKEFRANWDIAFGKKEKKFVPPKIGDAPFKGREPPKKKT